MKSTGLKDFLRRDWFFEGRFEVDVNGRLVSRVCLSSLRYFSFACFISESIEVVRIIMSIDLDHSKWREERHARDAREIE